MRVSTNPPDSITAASRRLKPVSSTRALTFLLLVSPLSKAFANLVMTPAGAFSIKYLE